MLVLNGSYDLVSLGLRGHQATLLGDDFLSWCHWDTDMYDLNIIRLHGMSSFELWKLPRAVENGLKFVSQILEDLASTLLVSSLLFVSKTFDALG